MKNIPYIILSIITVILLVLLYQRIFGGSTASPEPAAGVADTGVIGQQQITTVPTDDSSSLPSFIDGPLTHPIPNNPGQYQLGNYIDPASPSAPDSSYMVEYVAATNYFTISLLREPLAQSRITVEQFLQSYLNLSQAEMCELHYMLSTPVRVNKEFAGQSLKFSFCPDAVVLP